MKLTSILFASFCLTVYFCFTSFSDKKTQKAVAKTLNDNYSFIPSGEVEFENNTLSVQSFLIFKTEISNFEYGLFLQDLLNRGETEKYTIAKIDSSLWSDKNSTNMGYQEHYHTHIVYRDYPVVNISKEGAELYCEWVSEKINEGLASDKKIVFRLPTHAEWLRAAHGKLRNYTYPWGANLSDDKGNVLCNFLRLDATSIARDSSGRFQVFPWASQGIENGSSDVTAPIMSYWPNGFDLYNMSGNVAEMVSDKAIVVGGSWHDPGYDVRIESQKPYTGASRTVGFRMVATVIPAENEWLKVPKK